MATAKPFAYNPSQLPISGTTQFGDFAINEPVTGFTNSPQFWNGPDEDLGYIIGVPVPAGNQPNPVGIPAFLGFFRTEGFSQSGFTNLVSVIAQQSFPSSQDAYDWIILNNYYTNFSPVTPTPTETSVPPTPTPTETSVPPTPTPTETSVPPTPTPTETSVPPTPTPTPTSTDLSSITIYTISGCSSSNVLVADLLSPGLAPNDVFYLDFTGATTSECYKIINKVNDIPTDGSSPVTFYVSCTECLDQTTTVYSISGCTNMVTLNADLLSPNLFPGDVLYIEFTGSTADGCYTVIEKMFNTVPTDTVLTNFSYGSCGLCEAAIVTPTPTITETPTSTPTVTLTPSTTSIPVTGYGYNLIALPYNFPSSGNSIMNAASPAQTGTTFINQLTTTGRGFYFNSIDNIGVNRISYYSQFTGQSVTITFTQNGDSAVYSGDSLSFKFFSGNTGDPASPIPGSGFVFGTGVNTPQITGQTGNAVLIQSATTSWVTGATVYVSVEINIPTTPTPTPTNTTTPTPTTTPIPKFRIFNNSTGNRTITQVQGGGFWNLTSGSYPVAAGQDGLGLTHPSLTFLGLDQLIILFGGSDAIDLTVTKNGSPYTAASSVPTTNITASQINFFVNNPSDAIQSNDLIIITITDTI